MDLVLNLYFSAFAWMILVLWNIIADCFNKEQQAANHLLVHSWYPSGVFCLACLTKYMRQGLILM